jgi:predicted dehydrogenase
MKKMKQIAIVGMGRWGKNLIRDFSKLSKVKTCVTTGNKKNIVWLQQNYPSIDFTTDINQVLNDSDIDAVVIATPIKSHFTIAKKSLESKKHVFVEKPLTKTVGQAEKLVDIAKKNKLCLFVGHVFLYNEIFKKIKKIHENESIIYANFEWKKLGTFDEDIFENLLSHDLALNLELFGMPKKIQMKSKYSFLTPIDRFSLELFFNKTRRSEITIDRTSHYKKKTVMFTTRKNSYIWDDDKLLKFDKKTETYKEKFQSKNRPLYLECKEFIKIINAKNYSVDSAILAKKISSLISKISK